MEADVQTPPAGVPAIETPAPNAAQQLTKKLLERKPAAKEGDKKPAKRVFPFIQPAQKQGEPAPATPAAQQQQTPAATTPASPADGKPATAAAEPQKSKFDISEVNQIISKVTKGEFKDLDQFIVDYNKKRTDASLIGDDFIRDAIKYYNENGSLAPYLEAKAVDYDKMSAEDLIRKQMREEYPEYSEKAFNRLYAKEMEQYDTEDKDEEEQEFLNEEKRVRAERLKKQFKEKQQKFSAPDNKKQTEEEANQKAVAEYNNWAAGIKADANMQSLYKDKKIPYQYEITLPDGSKTAFDLSVPVANPDELYNIIIDPLKFTELFKKDGKLDMGKVVRLYAQALNEQTTSDLIREAYLKGRTDVEGQIKNTRLPVEGMPPARQQEGTDAVGKAKSTVYKMLGIKTN